MKKAIFILCSIWFLSNELTHAQELSLESGTVFIPKVIYKINPISFFETPQNMTFGIEIPVKNRLAYVQEFGAGFGQLDYYNNLILLKGSSELRRYFWESFQHRNKAVKNKYLAVDFGYRFVKFEMDEFVGQECNEWGWNCNYFERMKFKIKNYNFCVNLKYGKQILTPVKGILVDYFMGLGYEFIIAQSPLDESQNFRDWNVQPYYFKLANGQQTQLSVTAGVRIGYGKPKN